MRQQAAEIPFLRPARDCAVALEQPSSGAQRALHRYAIALAAATFVLIFVGGLVTSTGSALAVPDWPLSFGKFFPRMEGGVLYEHGHRMVAGTVALMTLLMAVWAWRRDNRPLVRNIALIALALVIFQAVLGGLTVLLRLPLTIAVGHAATAQAFFCLTITLVLLTNPQWERMAVIRSAGERPSLPMLAGFTTSLVYLQIIIGAVMRHMGAGLAIPDFPLAFGAIVPPLDSLDVQINFAHRVGAIVVTVAICCTTAWVMRFYRDQPLLRRPALALAGLLALQITLGALTVWSGRGVIPATAHVAAGAAVLGTSLCLTLRALRLIDTRLAQPSHQLDGVRATADAVSGRVTA